MCGLALTTHETSSAAPDIKADPNVTRETLFFRFVRLGHTMLLHRDRAKCLGDQPERFGVGQCAFAALGRARSLEDLPRCCLVAREYCNASEIDEYDRGGIQGKGFSIFRQDLSVKVRVRSAVSDETDAVPPINFRHIQEIHVVVNDQKRQNAALDRLNIEFRAFESLQSRDVTVEFADDV